MLLCCVTQGGGSKVTLVKPVPHGPVPSALPKGAAVPAAPQECSGLPCRAAAPDAAGDKEAGSGSSDGELAQHGRCNHPLHLSLLSSLTFI